MASRWLAAAFALALLVPLLEGLVPGLFLAQGSLAALSLLPWLALGPLPRGRAADVGGARAALYVGCLALPPLALAIGLDLARGAETRALAFTASGAWLVLVLWVAAAEWAVRVPRARRVYSALWLVLVPGAAALRVALSWAPLGRARGGRAPGTDLTTAFALDPLVWCHRWARPGGLGAQPALELGLALGAAALVLLTVLALARPDVRSR